MEFETIRQKTVRPNNFIVAIRIILFFSGCLFLNNCAGVGKFKADKEIVGWGDSMMAGAGGEKSIMQVMGEELKCKYKNFGVGGLTSKSVAVLQGGLPFQIELEDNKTSENRIIKISDFNIEPFNNQTSRERKGDINGVKGKLIRVGNIQTPSVLEGFYFQKKNNESIPEKQVIFNFDDAKNSKDKITIIWAGRNDERTGNSIYETKDNIRSMVNYLGNNKRFLVISICNGKDEDKSTQRYADIIRLNNLLNETFPNHFVDIRSYMVTHAMEDLGMTPTGQDKKDRDSDCIPSSLFYDSVHFNTSGYKAVGLYIARILKEKGWE